MSPAEVEKIWRACGLMEAFLGNSGSNHRLYAFAAAIERAALERAAEVAESLAVKGLSDGPEIARAIRALAGKAGEA